MEIEIGKVYGTSFAHIGFRVIAVIFEEDTVVYQDMNWNGYSNTPEYSAMSIQRFMERYLWTPEERKLKELDKDIEGWHNKIAQMNARLSELIQQREELKSSK